MGGNLEFIGFPKIHRLSRDIIITEKIDGTNAQLNIVDIDNVLNIFPASRNKFINTKDDNNGFAKWVEKHYEELCELGPGRHFGEWWGQGIQRNYGLKEKRFSLFNVSRWNKDNIPDCCNIVPILYEGIFDTNKIEDVLNELKVNGSKAAPGFMKPEGIVIYHTQANIMFKKTIENDIYGKFVKSYIPRCK